MNKNHQNHESSDRYKDPSKRNRPESLLDPEHLMQFTERNQVNIFDAIDNSMALALLKCTCRAAHKKDWMSPWNLTKSLTTEKQQI